MVHHSLGGVGRINLVQMQVHLELAGYSIWLALLIFLTCCSRSSHKVIF